MKHKLTTIFNILFSLILSVCALAGCQKDGDDGKAQATIVEATNQMVVIQVGDVEEEITLLSVMENLQAEGKLSFVVVGGMITELNGISNDVDYDPCWMLYTSDVELSNQDWGTVEYNGAVFGSAIVGAETLTVIPGGYYVWNYQSF